MAPRRPISFAVLLNLLSNAIKFTDKGRVTVEVTCVDQSSEKVQRRGTLAGAGGRRQLGKPQSRFASSAEERMPYRLSQRRTGGARSMAAGCVRPDFAGLPNAAHGRIRGRQKDSRAGT